MYNTNYACIYNKPDIFLKEEEDKLSEDDKDDIRNDLYRNDMLHILGVDSIADEDIDDILINLYERIKGCEFFIDCIKELSGRYLSEDKVLGLIFLYSYDQIHSKINSKR